MEESEEDPARMRVGLVNDVSTVSKLPFPFAAARLILVRGRTLPLRLPLVPVEVDADPSRLRRRGAMARFAMVGRGGE